MRFSASRRERPRAISGAHTSIHDRASSREEPALALHDALVRHLSRFTARMHTRSGPQVLITTHSAALLADAGIGLDEVHVLDPDSQGTEIKVGRSYQDVRAMVEKGGLSIGAALLSKARLANADRFSFEL